MAGDYVQAMTMVLSQLTLLENMRSHDGEHTPICSVNAVDRYFT